MFAKTLDVMFATLDVGFAKTLDVVFAKTLDVVFSRDA